MVVTLVGFGFLVGKQLTRKEVDSRSDFDRDGFIKNVEKTITGDVVEIKASSLVLIKNDNRSEVEIGSGARISLVTRTSGNELLQVATSGGQRLPPPEVSRNVSLQDLRIGDRVTILVTETPTGKRIAKVVSAERK